MDEGWLSVQEAADRCGVAYRTMLGMVRRGELLASRDGNASGRPYRVRSSDLDTFIERSRVEPGEVKAAPRREPRS